MSTRESKGRGAETRDADAHAEKDTDTQAIDAALDTMMRALTSPPPAPDVDARVRRAAARTFARAHAEADRPWVGAARAAWSRVVVPVGLAGVVTMYLTWAVETSTALMR